MGQFTSILPYLGSLSVEENLQWTAGTYRSAFTMILSNLDQKGMILIIDVGFRTKMVHKKALQLIVRRTVGNQPVTAQDASRVGINHENRNIPGIQQNRIGRFGSDSLYRKQSGPKDLHRLLKHAIPIALIMLHQEPDERL